jgi:hypothetical protein
VVGASSPLLRSKDQCSYGGACNIPYTMHSVKSTARDFVYMSDITKVVSKRALSAGDVTPMCVPGGRLLIARWNPGGWRWGLGGERGTHCAVFARLHCHCSHPVSRL